MEQEKKSILVVSENTDFSRSIADIFRADLNMNVTTEAATFSKMNGKGTRLASENDVVIFDADPDDAEETKAISHILSGDKKKAIFLALTEDDISLVKARKLQNIGIDEVLPKSITGSDLNEIVTGSLRKNGVLNLDQADRVEEGHVIAISQTRGGVGATTLAVNLALCLTGKKSFLKKAKGNRVALIDFDLQFGNVHVYLDLEDNGSFQHLLETGDTPDANYIHGMLQKHPSGLEVLNTPAALVPLNSLTPLLVTKIISHLKADFDYVIIDLPRAMVDWVEPVLQRSNQLLLVTDTSVPCVRQARRMKDFYSEIHIGLPVELVVNREKKPMVKSAHHKDAEAALDSKFAHWLPYNPKLARRAIDLGKPVSEIAPSSNLGKGFEMIARSVRTEMPVAKAIFFRGAKQ